MTQTTNNIIRMEEEPMIPVAGKDGNAGENYCQVCGGDTKFIGGSSYDMEEFECKDCKAIHNIRVVYVKGKAVERILESVY